MEDQELIKDVLEFVQTSVDLYGSGGVLGMLAHILGVGGIIRLWRSHAIQKRLAPKARWANWPKWVRFTVPPLLGAASGILGAFALGGPSAPMVITGALVGAIQSLTYKAKKTLDQKLPVGPTGLSPTGLIVDPVSLKGKAPTRTVETVPGSVAVIKKDE